MPLTVVANIQAKPRHESLVRADLAKLVAPTPTRAEAGCLRYDLHEDRRIAGHFVFYETWESRELRQAHMRAPHIAASRTTTDGAVDELRLSEIARVA